MSDSVILSILPLNPSNIDTLDFLRPLDNGIRVVSPDYLIPSGGIYYGDEIDLKFWKMLGLVFGKPKVKIVCMGDSLTAGHPYTTSKPVEADDLYSWTHTLRTLSGYEIINKGVSGQTSGDMLARFSTDVLALSPDYCIIECGTNDGNLTSPTNLPLATCLSNIQDMVDLCLANGITPIFAHYKEQVSQLSLYGLSSSDATYLNNYVESVETFEKSLGYTFLDFTSTVVSSSGVDMSKFSSDYIHPNVNGYQVWGTYANSQLYGLRKRVGTYLTRIDDYRYVYNHARRTFEVFDDTGTSILIVTGISSIADLNIDFTIHKSHQFEIVIDSSITGSRFIFPVTLLREDILSVVQESATVGVDNIYIPDRVRPYLPDDLDNPSYETGKIWSVFDHTIFEDYFPEIYTGTAYYHNLYGISPELGINWNKATPVNYFYLNRFDIRTMVKLEQPLKITFMDYNILLALLSSNLYPDLMSVVRPDESQVNRPVYEPWLIWGFFQFLANRTIDLDDFYPIPVFDLSPWWA